MQPRVNTDDTPVIFTVGSIRYRIPRSYLVQMDNWNGGKQDLVSIRVDLSDMHPLSLKMPSCHVTDTGIAGCRPFEFKIETPGSVSTEEGFRNTEAFVFPHQKPEAGPDGFEKFEIKSQEARTEYYHKVSGGQTLFYICQFFGQPGHDSGICYSMSSEIRPAEPTLNYSFRTDQLDDIDQIDRSIRALVRSFILPAGGVE